MARIAERKLTSEERCRNAFEALFSLKSGQSAATPSGAMWLGWREAWKYLEQRVTKEFIEK